MIHDVEINTSTHFATGGPGGGKGCPQGSRGRQCTRAYYNCVALPNALECHDQCLNTFPVNPNKPGMDVKLATKCINNCVTWGMGGVDYITIV